MFWLRGGSQISSSILCMKNYQVFMQNVVALDILFRSVEEKIEREHRLRIMAVNNQMFGREVNWGKIL